MESINSLSDIRDYIVVIAIIIAVIVIIEIIRHASKKKGTVEASTTNVDLSTDMVINLNRIIAEGDVKDVLIFLDKNPHSVDWMFEFREDGYPFVVTLLHMAVQHNRPKTAKLLIMRGADVNIRAGRQMQTPLEMAIEYRNVEIAELLLSHGGKYSATYLSDSDSGEFSTLLREYQEKPHYASILDAVNAGSILGVRELIDRGADLNVTDEHRQTPLHIAALTGSTEISKLLIDNGARIHAKDEGGNTPLQIARFYNHRRIVDMLKLKTGEE